MKKSKNVFSKIVNKTFSRHSECLFNVLRTLNLCSVSRLYVLYFTMIIMNMEIYRKLSINLRIHSKYGNKRSKYIPYLGIFSLILDIYKVKTMLRYRMPINLWNQYVPSKQIHTRSSKINTIERCEIYSKLTIRHQIYVIDVALVSLLLTLNIFHTFFRCFPCWFWAANCSQRFFY